MTVQQARASPMKMQELKEKTYQAWEQLCHANDALIQPEAFKPEVRKIGDLRCKATWQRALARFTAWWYIDTCLEAWNLIIHQLNFSPNHWDYDLRHLILEEFINHPQGLELIREGLEQLFSTDFTEDDRRKAHGFFELVGQQQGHGSIHGQSVEFISGIQQLTGTTGAERNQYQQTV